GPGGGDGPPERPPTEQPRLSAQVEPAPPGRRFDNDEPGPFPQTREIHIPPRVAEDFDESNTNGFYYVIFGGDGKELARTTNAPARVAMGVRPPRPRNPPPGLGPPGPPRPQMPEPVTHGEFREATLSTPPGEVIGGGRSIAADMNDLRLIALTLAAVGGGILVLGLAGGWWLATRAIRPIDHISATAVKISGGDLSRRIDVGDTDNELGRLAGV